MIASESEDEKEMRDCINNIITACTFSKIEPLSLPMFDVEMLFLKIRGKSVGEKIDLNVKCPDDNETRVKVSLDLNDVEVQVQKDHNNEVNITKDIKIVMRYPTLNDMFGMSGIDTSEADQIITLMKRCVHEVHEGEKIYNRVDVTDKDIEDFIESFSTEQLKSIMNFFETMPKIRKIMNVTNPKTKVVSEVVLEGMETFLE